MSKETVDGKENQDEQEFVAVEVDEKGEPLHAAEEQKETVAEDDDAEDSAEDERLGHDEDEDEGSHAGETLEEKRERRRRENRTKRIRNRVAAEAKDRLIENQGRTLLNLQEQVAQLQGRTVQYDMNLLQNALQQVELQQTDAKSVLAKLSKAGDHEGVAEVVELQMNLRDQHRQIAEQLRRAKSQQGRMTDGENPAAERAAPRAPAPDPTVMSKAKDWAAKNPWADPRSGDPEEAQIVRIIDQNLHREGWDPRGDDYWTELSERTKRYLPHRFQSASKGKETTQQQNGGGKKMSQSGGPKMAAASQSNGRTLGKNEVRVTPARRKAMEEAGMWADPQKRNRMLAQYAKYDREQVE